jgi:hypothetical protein
MQRRSICTLAGALALGAAATAAAQPRLVDDYSVRIARAPDWNIAAADGQCRLRLWVDDRARVELRGDQVIVRTETGRRSYDRGSLCNQPLPSSRVENFRLTAERGRGAVTEVESPARRNDFTATLTIDDPQAGGDEYELALAWHNPGALVAPLAVAGPYPGYDETRACQERVRGEFLARNRGDDAYLEFTDVPAREGAGINRERIRGQGWARNRAESRPISYECVVNALSDRVVTASYEVAGRGRYSALY